ncbi:hypothetical protein N0V86_002663 [Didymella sp. IMI 355093]|nr:hypothetical protein N0V86_002663 [Didymella sp. IMI 355093]
MNFDGASDSKPALETVQEHPATPRPSQKPTRLRRFMSIGSRGSAPSRRVATTTTPSTTPPLQALSPRPTESEPAAKKHAKRSISALLLSKPASPTQHEAAKHNVDATTGQGHLPVTETAERCLPAAAGTEDEGGLGSPGHLPVIGDPYHSVQAQPRKDSVMKSLYDMPLSASRSAALTSHPVGKEDLESEEEFQTPRESGGAGKGDCVEK